VRPVAKGFLSASRTCRRSRPASDNVLAQESKGPLERELGVRRAEAVAVLAVETVCRAGIDVNDGVRNALPDRLDVLHRDRAVLFAEVIHDRALRLSVEIAYDRGPVVGDGGGDRKLARDDVRRRSAPAVADDTDGQAAVRLGRGRLDVPDDLRPLKLPHRRAPVVDVLVV